MLALPPIDASLEGPVVVSTTYMLQRNVEPAGDIYEIYLMRRLGFFDEPEEDEDLEKESENLDKEKLNEKRKKANKADMLKNLVFKNHYHALGLEHVYFDATLDDVRKAYKQKVLTHHPDKFEEGSYDGIAKQQWLSVGSLLTRSKRPTRPWWTPKRRGGTTRPWSSTKACPRPRTTRKKSSSRSSAAASPATACSVRRNQFQLSAT